LRRTNENVKKPGNQCASDCENEDSVENALKPFDDRAGSEKKQDDGCFDEWQYREVKKVEREVYLALLVLSLRVIISESTHGIVLVVVGFQLIPWYIPYVYTYMPHLDI
jgi:hypothetical protein